MNTRTVTFGPTEPSPTDFIDSIRFRHNGKVADAAVEEHYMNEAERETVVSLLNAGEGIDVLFGGGGEFSAPSDPVTLPYEAIEEVTLQNGDVLVKLKP